MRFTGNLDLHRTLERTMRRGNLPLAYSQGFNPRPKLTLASALPLGYTSEAEYADFWLKSDQPLLEIAKALKKAAPPGIVIQEIKAIDIDAPKLQTSIVSAEYQVTLFEPAEDLEGKAADLLAADEVLLEKARKGKRREYDLRQLILDIKALPEDEEGRQRLELHLLAQEGNTGRPDDVLSQLDIDPLETHIHRTKIHFI
jgi:radical SAM-linked protein